MSARDAWQEVCTMKYRITGDILKATAFADSVERRIRAATLREAADVAESLREFEDATGDRKSAQVSENVSILRVADRLRRMADGTNENTL